ncbi:hypothetical protein [Salaquimonas pukyongi]|uniref:hypothetical protein n=1 Tax=Salaquimonas pukyongi TaxID=2712698 RepID=UPI0012EC9635|nr:hypothetical protein [Salaquimonas pukyongi]
MRLDGWLGDAKLAEGTAIQSRTMGTRFAENFQTLGLPETPTKNGWDQKSLLKTTN